VATARGGGVLLRRRLAPALGLVPFLAYLLIFLVIPTVVVLAGAFQEKGSFSLTNIDALKEAASRTALGKSVLLSGSTAVIGAVLGAVLAWLVIGARPTSLLRRAVVSLSGVFAQMGGVSLAFAWIATIGYSGAVTNFFRSHLGIDLWGNGWLYALPGLILVYCYFQIPLMVIVFLPALEGIRPQWQEAAVTLGASKWQYFSQVLVPLLRPAFLGCTLLLFANAFAAYATAAALVSQGSPIVPLMIRQALTSEVVLGRQHLAYALALEMVVVVVVVMVLYGLLIRRSAKWLR
jgi:putative spermidine/putrescine transport system permease protein